MGLFTFLSVQLHLTIYRAFLIPNYSVNVVWLYHELSLMKPYFLQQRHGVRQKNLNLGMIKKFMVPIVDINDQNVFVNFVQQVDKSKTNFNPFNFLPKYSYNKPIEGLTG